MTKILDTMAAFVQRLDAGPPPMESIAERYAPRPPEPVPATKQLRTNLERVTLAYNDRERVLVKEITEREAELADVRRARDATTAALMELDVDAERVEEEINGGAEYGETDLLPIDDIDALQVAAPRIESLSMDAAAGEQLDALGRIYSMKRRGPNEPDDEYRERIRREYKRLTAEIPA